MAWSATAFPIKWPGLVSGQGLSTMGNIPLTSVSEHVTNMNPGKFSWHSSTYVDIIYIEPVGGRWLGLCVWNFEQNITYTTTS
jgi:hypothetical protein